MKRGIVDCHVCGVETEVEQGEERLCDDCAVAIGLLMDRIFDGTCPLCYTETLFLVSDVRRGRENFMCGRCGGFFPIPCERVGDRIPSVEAYNTDPVRVVESIKRESEDSQTAAAAALLLEMIA